MWTLAVPSATLALASARNVFFLFSECQRHWCSLRGMASHSATAVVGSLPFITRRASHDGVGLLMSALR